MYIPLQWQWESLWHVCRQERRPQGKCDHLEPVDRNVLSIIAHSPMMLGTMAILSITVLSDTVWSKYNLYCGIIWQYSLKFSATIWSCVAVSPPILVWRCGPTWESVSWCSPWLQTHPIVSTQPCYCISQYIIGTYIQWPQSVSVYRCHGLCQYMHRAT